MSDEKRKQIAPLVVLAQHGNKKACRDLYIQYYKSIFFICNSMTGNISSAVRLTAEIFIKMFASVDKLNDHMAFESWFYSFALNICRKEMVETSGDIIDEDIIKNAKKAAECAKNHDKQEFERCVIKIIDKMIFCLPSKARIIFFYNYFAQLNAEKIALLEKISEQEAEKSISAVATLIEKQNEKIKNYGVDISAFTKDMNNTLTYVSSRKFIPDSLHKTVSESLGIDVNPFADDKREEKIPEQHAEPAKKIKEKTKFVFSKSDLILFFVIVAAVLAVFSVSKIYLDSKNEKDITTSTAVQSQEKKALLWNGAAAGSFDAGSGTKEDPYQIATGGQLAYLANLVNDGNSYYAACHYVLTADIILNKTDNFSSWETDAPDNEWTPIGSSTDDDSHAYFTGSFDGKDHTVSGMYITGGNDYSGLFGVVRNARIKNLTIRDSYIDGGSYTGGIAGYFAADTSEHSGFTFCGFSGIVKSNGNNTGGITGYFRAEGDGNMTEISYCFSSGNILAANSYAGGIAGVSEADSGSTRIKNCFNMASISAATKNSGGITGDSRAADGTASIENCYNSGKISASENAGGISGIINHTDGAGKVNIQNCFMLDTSADVPVTKGNGDEKLVANDITTLSDNEMKLADSFTTFNFSEIWIMPSEGTYKYPILKDAVFAYSEPTEEEHSSI